MFLLMQLARYHTAHIFFASPVMSTIRAPNPFPPPDGDREVWPKMKNRSRLPRGSPPSTIRQYSLRPQGIARTGIRMDAIVSPPWGITASACRLHVLVLVGCR